MKLSTLLITGSVAIGAASLLDCSSSSKSGGIKRIDTVSNSVRQGTSIVVSDSPALWGTSPIPFLTNQTSGGSYQDELMRWLNQHESFKIRISHMTWYWEFYGGKISLEEFQENIRNAYTIEQILSQNPELLQIMGKSTWGQRYLQGETIPSNVLGGNILIYTQIQSIKEKYPDMFIIAQENPMWETISKRNNGDDYMFLDQSVILQQTINHFEHINNHPSVQDRLALYGFSKDSILKGALSDIETEEVQAIYNLENSDNFSQEIWNTFWSSEVGQQYVNGQIDPNKALEYMNGLISQSQNPEANAL